MPTLNDFPVKPDMFGIIHAKRSTCGQWMLFFHHLAFRNKQPLHWFAFPVSSIPELDRIGFNAWAPHHLTDLGPKQ